MTLKNLMDKLRGLSKCHPEAKDAQVWATGNNGEKLRIDYVGYDRRHKPARIKLEE
jgi:hypothetical protein